MVVYDSWQRLMTALERIGVDPADDDVVRLQKRLLVAIASLIIPAAILWGGIYLVFDEPLAASIPLTYTAVSLLSIVVFGLTRRYYFFRFSQLSLILLLPFLLMLALGGFVNGSAVVLWSLICPLGALLFAGRRQALAWFLAFLGLVAISGALEPFAPADNNLPSAVVIAFFAMNFAAVSTVTFVLLRYFLRLLENEQEKSERLLLNVLPREIAAILKENNQTIADQYEAVSVLFADVVGSTALAVRLPPRKLVDVLNDAFSYFDSLVDKYGVEKIRTIGDNYMVASGVPHPRHDHAQALANMALEMNEYVSTRDDPGDMPLRFRIGMNVGPVVAGVIGHKKFHYDIWGDAVNTASHMESHGLPGKIQMTRATYELIKEEFVCQPRGLVEIKGKGQMETWFLEGIRNSGVQRSGDRTKTRSA